MPVYRITEFKTPDIGKVIDFCENLPKDAAAGAETIDVVSVGEGKGVIVARYTNQAVMDAATESSYQAFGKMIVAGIVNAGSIIGLSGDVVFSFKA